MKSLIDGEIVENENSNLKSDNIRNCREIGLSKKFVFALLKTILFLERYY